MAHGHSVQLYPFCIMTNAPKKMDVPGTDQPEGKQAAKDAAAPHDAPSKRPIWSMKLNRAESAMWANKQGGRMLISVAIFREYFDKREKDMRRGFYFDLGDLEDVRSLAKMALEKASELNGDTTIEQDA